MDASIEMKVQAVNKMLAQRKRLSKMLVSLGMYDGVNPDSNIIVYETSEFFQYAEILGAEARQSDYEPVNYSARIDFSYNGYTFSAYLTDAEVKTYADRIKFLQESGNV